MSQAINRREFLRGAAMAAAGVLAASCARATPQVIEKEVPVEKIVKETVVVEKQVPVEKVVKETVVVEKQVAVEKVVTATPVPKPKYQEAPMLAQLVKQGKLPPLEERLPPEPMVIEPFEAVGEYGGTMNVLMDITLGTNFMNIATYEAMLRWDRAVRTITPNVAQKWEISGDGRVFTFYLRKGIKWSDGQPFTADDIIFYFEDIAGNKELTPAYPTQFVIGGEPVKVDKLDDYTFRMSFVRPHGFLLHYMAAGERYWRPKHYLKQFHAKYTSKEELDKLVKAANFERWDQLFLQKDDHYNLQNPDYPVIQAWYPATPAPSIQYSFPRNPYYWKVDTQGKQLPYIDEVVVHIVEGAEVVKLKTVAGESDLQYRSIEFGDYPLLKENADKGGYRIFLWENPRGALPAFMPNQNCKDDVLRALIQDDRFRIALSHAINREQVNEMVFLGAGKPRQATEASSSPIYKEEYGRAYADYDPKKANALLDEMGLTKRDAEGYRLRPDGKTLFLLVETPGEDPATTSQVELLKGYWKDIGIKTELQNLERGVFRQRVYSGEVSIGTWLLDYVYYPYQPLFTVPISESTYWAPAYGRWYATGGKSGEEPTGDIRKLQLIWDQLVEVVDQKKQIELFQQLYDLHAKHCWMIGIVGEVPQPIVVSKRLVNVPEKGLYSWTHGKYVGWSQMEQYWFKS